MAARMVRRVGIIPLAWLLLLLAAAPAEAQVLGLLSVPEVFGDHACDRYEPEDVALHPRPASDIVLGWIQVETPWSFPEQGGGCQGLVVNVLDAATGEVEDLPVREFEYEERGLIVLDRDGRWYRVRLAEGSAWLRASGRSEFHALERLLATGPTYLTRAWAGRLAPSPGSVPDRAWGELRGSADGNEPPTVRVEEVRWMEGELWVHVVVLSHSLCVSPEEPRPMARGWLRAHAASGEPAIWYYSRGC